MTDTETDVTAVEEEDNTELVLWTWGLSGEPVTWASLEMQPVIAQIRLVNTGFGDTAGVQAALDAQYPDAGYLAANVCLAHPPSAAFTATVTGMSVRVDLAGDADLLLPDESVRWEWGDGSFTDDAGGFDHEYADAGEYEVRCTIPVAGVVYSTTQVVEVGEFEPVGETVDPAYAERSATVFESETDDLPNENAVDNGEDGDPSGSPPDPETDEPVEEDADEAFDPADHTVDEVLAYCADHPDEVDAIYAAEEAGKGRVTILDKLG